MKSVIIVYADGGNARRVAEILRKEIGGELLEIKTVKPYTGDYNTVVDQGKHEVDNAFEPEIVPLQIPIEEYDTILLGTPVWWYTFAPAIKTLLSSQNWEGKTVFPFATNAGWLGQTFEDITNACSGAAVQPGLDIRFDTDQPLTSKKTIVEWGKDIGC